MKRTRLLFGLMLLMGLSLSGCKTDLEAKRTKDTGAASETDLAMLGQERTFTYLRLLTKEQERLKDCNKACEDQPLKEKEACLQRCQGNMMNAMQFSSDTLDTGPFPDPRRTLYFSKFGFLNNCTNDTVSSGNFPDPRRCSISLVDVSSGDTVDTDPGFDPNTETNEEEGEDVGLAISMQRGSQAGDTLGTGPFPDPSDSTGVLLIEESTARPFLSVKRLQNLVVPNQKKPLNLQVTTLDGKKVVLQSKSKKARTYKLLTYQYRNYWQAQASFVAKTFSGPVRVMVSTPDQKKPLIDAEVYLVPDDNWRIR